MTLRRRTLVREINPHLICVLCSGYFIEATTIVECLHSFCRSCLVKYLEKNKFCPICDVQLHKNNPLLSVRCDSTLQQLVYKLIPGLYGREMLRRRKYYSELGGPSSDPDCGEFPLGDAYFSPEDSISLSLEFVNSMKEEEEQDEKQGVHHRRYLQCPAAVTMSHLKKFLRMKYGLNHDHNVDIIYADEVLKDDFSLMDVAYTFSWNRATPMRFKFRLLQKNSMNQTVANKDALVPKRDGAPNVKKSSENGLKRANESSEGPDAKKLKVEERKKEEERRKEEKLKKEKEERLRKEEKLKKEREERLKRENEEKLRREDEERLKKEEKLRKERREKEKQEERLRKEKEKAEERARKERKEKERKEKEKKRYDDMEEDIEEIDDDDDRLQITTPDDDVEEIDEPVYRKSEERRKEKKKNKKAKHHHHHRHRSPPAATILHSPENDIMKLKIKLNDKKYVVEEKNGYKEKKEEETKADVANNNEEIKTKNEVASKEMPPLKKPPKLSPVKMVQNGKDVKMPPSSITVSKITAAEKRQMEQQKKTNGDSKRPSLEIMLVNAPKKEEKEVKKVIRPPPQSIPLSRVKNVFGPKSSPPPLVPTKNDEALDLSKRSPDVGNLVTLSDTAVQVRNMMIDPPTLKIPAFSTKMPYQRAIKPVPNQTVRQIPNPSALMFRNLNGRSLPPPGVPINSLRKMESMTKNIEKVAAGLTVKAAVEAGFALK